MAIISFWTTSYNKYTYKNLLLKVERDTGNILFETDLSNTLASDSSIDASPSQSPLESDSNNNVFVVDYTYSSITKLDSSGNYQWSYPNNTNSRDWTIYEIRIDSSENIIFSYYYYDSGAYYNIEKISQDGVQQWIYSSDSEAGRSPANLWIDSNDNIVVADDADNKIFVHDGSDGSLLYNSDYIGDYNTPHGVVTDSNNNIYVRIADVGIYKYNSSCILQWSQDNIISTAPGTIRSPAAISSNDEITITGGQSSSYVTTFDTDGNFIRDKDMTYAQIEFMKYDSSDILWMSFYEIGVIMGIDESGTQYGATAVGGDVSGESEFPYNDGTYDIYDTDFIEGSTAIKNLKIKNDDTWVTPETIYIKNSGVWKQISKIFIKNDNTWSTVWKP